jgi:hypothetical protein
MSVECKGEERREARRSFTGDELRAADNVPVAEFQRATARARGWRVQSVSKCERDKMEVMPGFYTDRDVRRGSGKVPAAAHLPLMAGGLCGRQEKKNEKKLEGVCAGINCLSQGLKEGRRSETGAGQDDGRRGGRAAETEERGREKGEGADRWGRHVSDRKERRKGKG